MRRFVVPLGLVMALVSSIPGPAHATITWVTIGSGSFQAFGPAWTEFGAYQTDCQEGPTGVPGRNGVFTGVVDISNYKNKILRVTKGSADTTISGTVILAVTTGVCGAGGVTTVRPTATAGAPSQFSSGSHDWVAVNFANIASTVGQRFTVSYQKIT
jgi:hypothetical protein